MRNVQIFVGQRAGEIGVVYVRQRTAALLGDRQWLGDQQLNRTLRRSLQRLHGQIEGGISQVAIVHLQQSIAGHQVAVLLRHAAADQRSDDDYSLVRVQRVTVIQNAKA